MQKDLMQNKKCTKILSINGLKYYCNGAGSADITKTPGVWEGNITVSCSDKKGPYADSKCKTFNTGVKKTPNGYCAGMSTGGRVFLDAISFGFYELDCI